MASVSIKGSGVNPNRMKEVINNSKRKMKADNKVYAVFNGTRYEFDCDVNLDGYLEQCCNKKVETNLENGVFYADELPRGN